MDLDYRDLTYSSIARSRIGRATIRILENLTGRPTVLWRMRGLRDRLTAGETIWNAVWETFGLTLTISGSTIPTTGPALIIANHPYGLIDSLALCKALAHGENPFHIVANDVFLKAGPIADYILPITYEPGRNAARRNLRTRDRALALLKNGGRVAVFPAGATAGPARPFGLPHEVAWSSFAARLAKKSGAPVIPVYFPIRRRPVFDMIGYVHPNLRHALQISGFYSQMDSKVRMRVGPNVHIDSESDVANVTATLRRAVLTLGDSDPKIEGRRF